MPPERLHPNPLTGVHRLLLSRASHLILGALTVLAVLFSGYDATKTRPSDGTVWLLGRPELEVLDILPRSQGVPTPLRRGDKIVGIGTEIVTSPQKAAEELRRQVPGTTIPYLIIRERSQQLVPVPLTSTRVDLQDYAVNIVLAVVYLVIGFAVYLRSANERPAGLFFVLCLMFSLYFMTNLQQASYFLGAIIAQNIGAFARFMLPAIFLHFFLTFPRKKLTLTRHPFLSPLLYILPWMFYLRFTLNQFIGPQGARIDAVTWIVLGIYYVLGLSALLHGYFSYRDPLMRQRVRILTFGTLVAVIPFLIIKIGMEELSFQTGLTRLGSVPLAAIPISFGYCVARYQVLQIDLLLKRNLAYGLQSGLNWVLYLGGAWWLGGKVLALLPTDSPLVTAGAALAVAAALWPVRAGLQRSLDRRFYHSRDNMAAVIEEFSKEIPRLIQRETLLKRVGDRLCAVLELPGLAFYLVDTESEEPGFELGAAVLGPAQEADGQSLDPEAPPSEAILRRRRSALQFPQRLLLPALAQALQSAGEPYWVDTDQTADRNDREAITLEQAQFQVRLKEQRHLIEHGIQLLIPLVAQNRLVGMAAMPLRPGQDYEVHELQLVTIVAGQVALQVENSRLYEEEVAKQKMEEEMAMARRIQARLLPGVIPSLQGVDIHAVNISSKQVSGDYYDLIERQDGRLALVIADVSGKGMPASILASNLQAALRAQCDTCDSPCLILERINRQIHASTDPQHFATLFLAMLDPTTRRLVYSSGGHNAPVLVRSDGTCELLEKGGLPLGAFDFGHYEEGEVFLQEGDLLFLYTDGLTETKGPDGDEDFGEARLNDLLRERFDDEVVDLIANVNTSLQAFRGRREIDDDITMIALKIALGARAAMAGAGQT